MTKLASNLWKTRSLWALEEYIMKSSNKEVENIAKEVWRWYWNLDFSNELTRKILFNQIALNQAGEQGFKSAITFTFYHELFDLLSNFKKWDLQSLEKLNNLIDNFREILLRTWLLSTEFWKKFMNLVEDVELKTKQYLAYELFYEHWIPEEEIRRFLWLDNWTPTRYSFVELYKDILGWLEKTNKWVKWLTNIIPIFVRFVTRWKLDKDVLSFVFEIWSRSLKTLWLSLRQSEKNLINKIVTKIAKERWLVSEERSLVNLFKELWFIVKDIRKAEKWLKEIVNWKDAKKIIDNLINEWVLEKDTTLTKAIEPIDFIRLNYFRFDPKIAYNLNKIYIERNPSLYKVNKQLYDFYTDMLNKLKLNWIEPARREILWLSPKIWAPIIETDWKILWYKWREITYRVNWQDD